nr:MAG TPA: hypothetical protein [Caudoviricetes sp.]
MNTLSRKTESENICIGNLCIKTIVLNQRYE